VRLVPVLLALPMSYWIFRAAAILFGGIRIAATAALLINVTLIASVGTMIVTPDAPLLVASSLVLFCLAKLLESGRGVWWLATGAAVGLALLSVGDAAAAGLAAHALAISRRAARSRIVRSGHSVERRPSMGLFPEATDGPGAV
jgi:4-amino-4-deoxy-L-arabinose transferase-like glycosyltransferase